jgi:hypothetical protein
MQVVAEWLLFIARRTCGCRYSMARLHVSGRYPYETGEDGKRKYTVQQIADEFGATRPTVYRHLSKATSSS